MLPFDELNKDSTLTRHHAVDEFHGVPRQERPGVDTYEENDPIKVWKERGDGYLVAVEASPSEAFELNS
jgi:hypothetical protein